MAEKDPLIDLLKSKGVTADQSKKYSQMGLAFNPFPRAGISDLNSSDELISKLIPIDPEIQKGILEYSIDSLFPQNPLGNDLYLSMVIRGDYGYGKTQTLLYAKYILESFTNQKDFHKTPYVVYIDNPGAKLMELIGSIIAQIGEENFKRYLWNTVLENLADNEDVKNQLLTFKPKGYALFEEEETSDPDPFAKVNTVSYKKFLDGWMTVLNPQPKKKKAFLDILKTHSIAVLTKEFKNSTVALYFYALLSENIGINKTWEMLTSGTAKDLDKKEVYIIGAISKLIRSQGFTNFYILVDEFEAVTAGRLKTTEIDRYVTNLRALIDKERNWCAMFAMTGLAFSRLKGVSPPLAERISSRVIDLKPLNLERAEKITVNYLNLAREPVDSIVPFDKSGLKSLQELSNGILRLYLKSCFTLLQRASEELKENETINSTFVEQHFQVDEE